MIRSFRRTTVVPSAMVCVAGVLIGPSAAAGWAAETAQAFGTAQAGGSFTATSTSWTSATDGWVFGYRGCGPRTGSGSGSSAAASSCSALYETTDAGRTWSARTAPRISPTDDSRQVRVFAAGGVGRRTIVVTNGHAMLGSYDGTKTWHAEHLAGKAKPVVIGSITASSSRVYVLVSSGNDASGRTTLMSAPLGHRGWRAEPGLTTATGDPNAATADVRAARDGGPLLATIGIAERAQRLWVSPTGSAWARGTDPCETEATLNVAPAGPRAQYLLCSSDPGWSKQTKDLYASSDGRTYRHVGQAPRAGFTIGLAVTPQPRPRRGPRPTAVGVTTPARGRNPLQGWGYTIAIGATGGDACFLHESFDGGRTWRTPLALADRGPVLDLDFTDAEHGTLICGTYGLSPMELYRTSDAGHSWHKLTLPVD